jgi:hypothetical protein
LDHLEDIYLLKDTCHNDQVEDCEENIQHENHPICKDTNNSHHRNRMVECHFDKSDGIEK